MTDSSAGPAAGAAELQRHSKWFVWIAALFVTCLITANIIAAKLVLVAGLVLPAAVIVFPLSYVIGDVMTEVYGFREARRLIWLGFFCNGVAVAAIWIGGRLPAAPFWDGQDAYARILGAAPRIVAASFLAYLAGEFTNAVVMAKMKVATRGRWLWTRTIGSTLVGQGVDSLVFMSAAFAGVIPAAHLISAVVTQWLAKSAVEALLTPVTYRVIHFLKRREQLDVFDADTRFNPFLLSQ